MFYLKKCRKSLRNCCITSQCTNNALICVLQHDRTSVDEIGHRCQSPQRNFSQSSGRHTFTAVETLEVESCVSVWIHVTTFGICQLHPISSEVLQSKHYGLRSSQEQVKGILTECINHYQCRHFCFSIAILDFPSCVIGDQPELTAESLEIGSNLPYCWRNLYSCVNLLRILNKLTKWKHSRIMVWLWLIRQSDLRDLNHSLVV